MKYLFIVLGLMVSGQSLAADLIVTLSPYQSSDAATRQAKMLFKVMAALPPAQEALVINGDTGQSIARFKTSERKAQQSLKGWAKANRVSVAKLMQFARQAKRDGRTSEAVNVPRLMRVMAKYHKGAKDLLIIGSPLYDAPDQPALFMGGNLVPSDGFFMAGADTPFGTAHMVDALKGLRVHWLLSHPLNDDNHAYAVERFYHLYIHRLGGQLVSFTNDTDSILFRFTERASPLAMPYQIEENAKLEMLRVRKLQPQNNIYDGPVSQVPRSSDSVNESRTFSVGIQWTGQVDIDLYAMNTSNEQLVYFNNTTTDKARHFKDILSGNHADQTFYETIEFHQPVKLSDIIIALNHYGGDIAGDGIFGSVRVAVGGKTYAMPFSFHAPKGNKGADIGRAIQTGKTSPHSIALSLMDIMQANTDNTAEAAQ